VQTTIQEDRAGRPKVLEEAAAEISIALSELVGEQYRSAERRLRALKTRLATEAQRSTSSG
jgi:hypothetical protein